MSNLFFIGVGGSGAKVAEAFVHLCAAGLGPEFADILLIDVDVDNGNLRRTRACLEQYARLCRWPWGGKGDAPHLFRTKLRLHVLVQGLEVISRGGLQSQAVTAPPLLPLLDLFFDESEQTSDCAEGFFARPNLGSLVMGSHLRERFLSSTSGLNTAPEFMEAMRAAISQLPNGSKLPVAVAGSVFGGTGASVFPVVREALRGGLAVGNTTTQQQQHAATSLDKVQLSAVMLLPYFAPQPEGEFTVDPTRFLLDTSNALQHYGETSALEGFSRIYLVGSDRPGRNVLEYRTGSKGQANPPMIEEVVAGIGLLHLVETAGGGDGVHVYHPSGDGEKIRWTDLPWPAFPGRDPVRSFRTLLHVAAFYLHEGSRSRPLGLGVDASMALWKGDAGSEEVNAHPWFKPVLQRWAENFEFYRQANLPAWDRMQDGRCLPGGASAQDAADTAHEYFGRLLCWADHAFEGGGGADLDLLQWDSRADGLPYWEAMSLVQPGEVEHSGSHQDDNALVRVLRIAIAGTQKLLAGTQKRRRSFTAQVQGNGNGDARGINTALPEGHRRADLQTVREEYERTQAKP